MNHEKVTHSTAVPKLISPRRGGYVEAQLLSIWEELLERENIDLDDDFFDLGGDSLLASRITSRVERDFGAGIALQRFYEGPTVRSLAIVVREQLEARPKTTVISRPRTLPLSYNQEQFWVLAKLGFSDLYHSSQVMRIIGPFDENAFEQALQSLMNRHESLRTSLRELNGELVQEIIERCIIPIEKYDLVGPTAKNQRESILKTWAKRPFDLGQAPLWRALLLRLEPEEHIFGWCLHHVICDGWSLKILRRELEEIYAAHLTGRSPNLKALPFQYADFAIWQRSVFDSDRLEEGFQFWEKRLAGHQELALGSSTRRLEKTDGGGHVRVKFSTAEAELLRNGCRQNRTTLYTLLMAGVYLVISRYTSQRDICIGMPVANRKPWETEAIVGCFVNTLVLRLNAQGDEEGQRWLKHVQTAIAEAQQWQQVPFDKLVERLNPTREFGRNPFIQVAANYVDRGCGTRAFGAATIKDMEMDRYGSRFDLAFELVVDGEGTLELDLNHGSKLGSPAWVVQIGEHVRQVMIALIEEPQCKIRDIGLLREHEERQILYAWNDTKHEVPELTLSQLFEAQVKRKPDAIALAFEEHQLTYGELNRRSNQVANYLQSKKIKPEVKVGLCVDRSVEMVVVLLGIVKAGGVYVPLDPTYPLERLTYMMEDAQLSLLLQRSSPSVQLERHHGDVINLDREWSLISASSPTNPVPVTMGQNLAYVIYTSGSTGKPKGVMIPHAALVNCLHAMGLKGMCGEDTILAVTPLSFDIAGLELFLPLVTGGKVCVASAQAARNGDELKQALEISGSTIMQATPITWKLLLQAGWKGGKLQKVLCGGEAMPRGLRDELLERCGVVWNLYGPTETTIWSAAAEVDRGELDVPIGCPIANTQIYILDDRLMPVPPGVSGGMYIAGLGVARGYLNRQDFTAEKFIPNPYGLPGGRMYWTGDLAKWRNDGSIEFLGREDAQVKIRGFRIEPAEVEATILDYEGIEQAAVVVREDHLGERRLGAYIVPSIGASIDTVLLRKHMSRVLPEYMIPAAFVQMQKLPLTPNGKLDRKSLPVPEFTTEMGWQVPRTQPEEILCSIVGDVLGIPTLHIHDNFFELGGHSLLAIQLISRIRQAWGVDLPVQCVFEHPTPAGLAAKISETLQEYGQTNTPAKMLRLNGNLPLSFGQKGQWFFHQLDPDSGYNINITIRFNGPVGVVPLMQSVSEIARRHESLRVFFTLVDDEPSQSISDYKPRPFPIVDLSSLSVPIRDEVLLSISRRGMQDPFDLSMAPPVRIFFVRLEKKTHLLSVTTDHIVSDGWSLGLLCKELSQVYSNFLAGDKSELPELTLQYADFAVWQQTWTNGDEYKRELAYWKEQLKNLPARCGFPIDKPRPKVLGFEGGVETIALPSAVIQALKELTQRENASLFMALLSLFHVLLHRYTGETDILTGSPIAGRNSLALESLIGFFVNTLVIRTDLSDDPSFLEVVKRVREVTLAAYSHQNMPFEKLVEDLHVERNLNRTPLFQVMFALQNLPPRTVQVTGVETECSVTDPSTERFEMRLVVAELGSQMVARLSYNKNLFYATTALRILHHFARLLEVAVRCPQSTISELCFLSDPERHQCVREWSAAKVAAKGSFALEPFVGSLAKCDAPVYILDGRLHPMPIGAVGQIYIGGILGFSDEQSSQPTTVVRDPHSSVPDSWMRDTGLLGRYMMDGAVEVVSSSDQNLEPLHWTKEGQSAGMHGCSGTDTRIDMGQPPSRAELMRRRTRLSKIKQANLTEQRQA